MNLRYEMNGSPCEHPQKVMRELGVAYTHSTPQSIADQWWFWNCENVPQPMPPYLTELTLSPHEAIGHGLDKKRADEIAAAIRNS